MAKKSNFMKIGNEVLPLLESIQKGEAVDVNFQKVLEKFQPIIKELIKKTVYSTSIDVNDLEQEAAICLWKSCLNYRMDSPTSFYSYYCGSAMKALFNYVFMYQQPITVSRHELERTSALRKFSKEFKNTTGEYPTSKDCIEAGFDKEISKRYCFLNMLSSGKYDSTFGNDSLQKQRGEGEDMDEVIFKEIEKERLYKAINSLDPKCKEVLILKYIEDRTYTEICRITGLSLSQVRTYKNKAITTLQSLLKEQK